ncbi:MAG: 50S ribosomal protein L4 [Deltaproteobacteria bacterium]|nr:50S ribosomal protein L4 [Deltaproteobacteria bacterium]
MTVVDVYNLQKEKISELELESRIFDVPVKQHVLHQVIISQLSSHRSGSPSARTRSEVKASGRKLWRQKGTGRARVGSSSSPTRRGGGVAFGPIPQKRVRKVPKKVKKAALCMALTDKVKTGQLYVIDSLDLPEVKTKKFVGVMKIFDVHKALLVTQDKAENLGKSSKNVPWVKVMRYEGLNVYDILKYKHLFIEQSAISKIGEALDS